MFFLFSSLVPLAALLICFGVWSWAARCINVQLLEARVNWAETDVARLAAKCSQFEKRVTALEKHNAKQPCWLSPDDEDSEE